MGNEPISRGDREWFVSYDVTGRRIVLQRAGDDEHEITADEAEALRHELLAALMAEHEHRMLRGMDEPSGRCCDNGCFGEDHDCQKQDTKKSPPIETEKVRW